ncbi:MAG: helix-turn-helix transcriptional regulator [Planctomycetota bacterium]
MTFSATIDRQIRAWCRAGRQLNRFLPCAGGLGRISCCCRDTAFHPSDTGSTLVPPGQALPLREAVPSYGISCILEGRGQLRQADGSWRTMQAPCLLRLGRYLPEQDRLRWQPGQRLRECVFNCDERVGDHLAAIGLWPPGDAVETIGETAAWLRTFRACWEELSDARASQARILGRCIDLISLSGSIMVRHGDQLWLAQAQALLAEAGTDGPGLAQIARRLDCSERQFRRRFQALSGTTPRAWRLQTRMARAAERLLEADVATVAAECGYSEASAFSRQFSRSLGIPPSSIARSR